MEINWPEKNTAELELFFSTDAKKGLTGEYCAQARKRYGENIIDSKIMERQNFYGPKKKKRNIKAALMRSAGITGILCFLTAAALKAMDFDVNIYIFPLFYIFLVTASFILISAFDKKYEYLNRVSRPKALVIRQNKRKKVFMENIVPGDLVLLSAGDIVPADARIVFADRFACIRINEEGGFIKMPKTSAVFGYDPSAAPGLAVNMAYAADAVYCGSASAIVTATGENTFIAKKTGENTEDIDTTDTIDTKDTKEAEPEDERSVMQKYAGKISKDFLLASVFFAMVIIISGIIQNRDTAEVILTCLTVSAACFSEQLTIIADYAVIRGMGRMAKFGILIKKTSVIDSINNIDTLIAKKNESFTHEKMHLKKISGREVSVKTAPEIGYMLSCMAMCSNVTAYKNKDKTAYSGSALDIAVFEAIGRCGLRYDAINQVYQKLGKTIYNPENGIKSAVVLKDGKFNLVCFGEASVILERCAARIDVMGRSAAFDAGSLNYFAGQTGDLYREYDLVMAVAAKDFNYRRHAGGKYSGSLETDLVFLGFACFSQPKTHSVFESIDYLKKSGVNPVMIADSASIRNKNAAVKFGITENLKSANMIDDFKIDNMDESMFFINADKFNLFAPISLQNKIKLLKALKFKGKSPAITINEIEEISLLGESCTTFTSINTETGILKNKASVITKNLTVSTILKTVRNAALIYGNICKIIHFSSAFFISQHLLILLAVILNGGYILNPAQIIWAGAYAGYMFAVALCFCEDDKKWHVLRNKIKEYRRQKKFIRTILKYGALYGLLLFAFTALSFFIRQNANGANAQTAQTCAFVTYIVSCVAIVFQYVKGARFFDLKALKNKPFVIFSLFNLSALWLAVFIPQIREFLNFGEIGASGFLVAALLGLCPATIAGFFKKRIFFL